MDQYQSFLLLLLRRSLGVSGTVIGISLSESEIEDMLNLSYSHGVAALALDGYQNLISAANDDYIDFSSSVKLSELKIAWLSRTLQVENDYKYKFATAARFANLLVKYGVECKVMKGISFSTYYANPEHRECGDCDVYLGSGFEIGNDAIKELGGKYEFGTYKHSHLYIGKLMIENHHYLTDFNATKQGKKIEYLLERVINETPGNRIGDSDLISPNDHFNALFLIKHAHGNFMSGGLTLRMIYDWAALLKSMQNELPWTILNNELIDCHLMRFADVLTSLCVKYLGVTITNSCISLCQDGELVDEIMLDTLNGGINSIGKEIFPMKCVRICKRFKRLWHYRELATESYPRMVWNNFAFSSYMKRNISL